MPLMIRPIQEKESDAVYQMFQDIPAEENGATNHAHGMTRPEFDDFCKKMAARSVAQANGRKEFSDGKVPQTIYIIVEEGIPVGFGKFRPFLNEACFQNRAGHFAFMISPKHRCKGCATKYLEFIKGEATTLGLPEIEGVALESNVASCRVMEKNGGTVKQRIDGDVVYAIKLGKTR